MNGSTRFPLSLLVFQRTHSQANGLGYTCVFFYIKLLFCNYYINTCHKKFAFFFSYWKKKIKNIKIISFFYTLKIKNIFSFCFIFLQQKKSNYNFFNVQRRGKKTLLSLTLICYCHLVGMAKIVRGSTCTTMKHRYLTIWLTYCTNLALPFQYCLNINLRSIFIYLYIFIALLYFCVFII